LLFSKPETRNISRLAMGAMTRGRAGMFFGAGGTAKQSIRRSKMCRSPVITGENQGREEDCLESFCKPIGAGRQGKKTGPATVLETWNSKLPFRLSKIPRSIGATSKTHFRNMMDQSSSKDKHLIPDDSHTQRWTLGEPLLRRAALCHPRRDRVP